MKKRLLVTGASGFLGWNVCQFPQDDWEIIGTYHNHPTGIFNTIMAVYLDLTDLNAIHHIFKTIKPDGVLHLGAISRINICEKQPTLSRNINVHPTELLADLCRQSQIPFVFTSSSQVFDGTSSAYKESDPVHPITTYAHHKLEAERLALATNPKATIGRMPLMYGDKSPTSVNFLPQWVQKLKNRELLTVFTDEIRQPASGQSAAAALFLLLKKQPSGVFNIAGSEVLSRADFANIMARIFNLPTDTLQYCLQQDVPMAANRPKNLSLNIDKIKELGFNPKGVEEELIKLRPIFSS